MCLDRTSKLHHPSSIIQLLTAEGSRRDRSQLRDFRGTESIHIIIRLYSIFHWASLQTCLRLTCATQCDGKEEKQQRHVKWRCHDWIHSHTFNDYFCKSHGVCSLPIPTARSSSLAAAAGAMRAPSLTAETWIASHTGGPGNSGPGCSSLLLTTQTPGDNR